MTNAREAVINLFASPRTVDPVNLIMIDEESPNRSHWKLLSSTGQKLSYVWKYMKRYSVRSHPTYEFIICCTICHELEMLKSEPKCDVWEINYGESRSTSKLTRHIRIHHPEVHMKETQSIWSNEDKRQSLYRLIKAIFLSKQPSIFK